MRRLLDALAAKRLSPRSRSGLLGILSGLLAYGVRQGVVERNVVRTSTATTGPAPHA